MVAMTHAQDSKRSAERIRILEAQNQALKRQREADLKRIQDLQNEIARLQKRLAEPKNDPFLELLERDKRRLEIQHQEALERIKTLEGENTRLKAKIAAMLPAKKISRGPQKTGFRLDNYTLVWMICRTKSANLMLVKTQDTLRAVLEGNYLNPGKLHLSAQEAERLGTVLGKVEQYRAALADKDEGTSNEQVTEDIVIVFRKDPETGFLLGLHRLGSERGNILLLERTDAKTLAPHLQLAPEKMAYLKSLLP